MRRPEREIVDAEAPAEVALAAETASMKDTLAALALAAPLPPGDPLATQAESRALRSRLLSSLRRPGRYGVFTDRIARLFDISHDAAFSLLSQVENDRGERGEAGPWRPWLAEGVSAIPVEAGPKFPNALAAIGRLRPGGRFPHHEHVGDEVTVVLEGGFRDEADGAEVWRGEELFKAAGTAHGFVVLEGVDCIAAVLAVGGVSFR